MNKPGFFVCTAPGLLLCVLTNLCSMHCLVRPLSTEEPVLKDSFTKDLRSRAVDKIDLLFVIDNSSSMGEKQQILSEAVPDLVSRLLKPNCVTETGAVVGQVAQDGSCSTGKAEFAPIADIHLGILSSSLGGVGAKICLTSEKDESKNPLNSALDRHNNDQGHLLERTDPGGSAIPLENQVAPILAWFPHAAGNAGSSTVETISVDTQFLTSLQGRIRGVHEYGCGYEAPLEAVYRFLIQPDPYNEVVVSGEVASLKGIDKTILEQRRSFLRPDSLVAVVMVTDGKESSIDPLSFYGRGWSYLNPSSVKPGTQICGTDPSSAACKSCWLEEAASDPGCSKPNDNKYNVRAWNMRQRFGVDAQFPVQRYIDGFRSTQVPNRFEEHPLVGGVPGPYPDPDKIQKSCTNPLFASELPSSVLSSEETAIQETLCKLPLGPRTPDMVFFSFIGGVPAQLLHFDPNNPQASALSQNDWIKLLGKDPEKYNFQGIDPHMLESFVPRTQENYPFLAYSLPAPTASDLAVAPGDPMKIPGREWDTQGNDGQYACTFPLPTPKDCTFPTLPTDQRKKDARSSCDCSQQNVDDGIKPPLCQPGNNDQQIRGKAYPSSRLLRVVQGVGQQGTVASICPVEVSQKDNAQYGYRPAVSGIVTQLKNALAVQGLPESLTTNTDGTVSCVVWEMMPVSKATSCDATRGRKSPDPLSKKRFVQAKQEVAARRGGSFDADQMTICQVQQLAKTDFSGLCENASKPGWCYVEEVQAGGASQAIKFSKVGNPPPLAQISLQCINQK